MAKILKPYEVPVVSNDLTFPETLQDVFFALDSLTKTMDEAFGKISKRVEDERQRVSSINERLTACHTKVQSISGSNRATTVFSTAKFPGPKTLPVFTCLFNQLSQTCEPYREPEDDVIYALPRTNRSCVGNRELAQEILTILCRLNNHNSEMRKTEFIMEDKGLGPLPAVLPSVGSLLLYNSNVNPYKNYQYLDNLEAAGRMRAATADDAKGIALAPSTLLNGDILPDIDNVDLNFRPDMGDINAFALPDNLPLDFVAVDVAFQGVVLPNIAPSAQYNAKAANFNLPQLTDGGVPMTAGAAPPPPPADTSAAAAAPASAPPPPPAPVAAAAAPPPPPPPGQQPVPTAEAAPPPPPPSAPAAAAPAVAPATAEESAIVPAADDDDSGGGGGSSFLDAIKGMNVNKLRKKEESSVAAAKVQKKEEQKKPLSVGEELRLKLQRRNNAMTGASGKEQQKKDAALVEAAKSSSSSAAAASASASASASATADKPLPSLPSLAPSANSGGSTLKAVGFKSAASRGDDGFDSDGSDDENSVGSFEGDNLGRVGGGPSAAAPANNSSGGKVLPALPGMPAKASSPPPANMPPPIAMPMPEGAQRRGSNLMDTSAGSTVSNLLNAAKAKNEDSDSGGDDEWDS